MNKFNLFTILFFTLAVSVSALDTIVLTNGTIIDAKVEEITPAEIRYRRADNLRGPLIFINKSDVLSIRYENGIVEIMNPVSAPTPAVPASPSAPPLAPATESAPQIEEAVAGPPPQFQPSKYHHRC